MTTNELAWQAMSHATLRHYQPRHFLSDFLVRDRQRLGLPLDRQRLSEHFRIEIPEHDPAALPEGTPFGWVLRDSGTDLLCPFDVQPGLKAHAVGMIRHYIQGGRSYDDPHFFVWDGEKLIETTVHGLASWIYSGIKPYPVLEETSAFISREGGN